MKRALTIEIIYLGCCILSYGGLLQDRIHWSSYCSEGAWTGSTFREAAADSAMFSLLGPISLFTSIFASNFWEHGWSLRDTSQCLETK